MALAPFRGFWDVPSEVDSLFNTIVGDLLGRRLEGFAQERLWAPRLEVFAREGDLVIHADLPGVALEDVDITLERTTLTISGERKTLAGVGKTLGISRERARQLENAALSELRERRRELGLEGLAA
jgi:HSP20 family molecular chaperone IbpA